jgi:hypothetical protein
MVWHPQAARRGFVGRRHRLDAARSACSSISLGFEASFEELAEASSTGDARLIQHRRADLALKYRLDYLTQLVPDLKAKYGLMLIGEWQSRIVLF